VPVKTTVEVINALWIGGKPFNTPLLYAVPFERYTSRVLMTGQMVQPISNSGRWLSIDLFSQLTSCIQAVIRC
jgi:hypothetical protein